MNTAKRNLGLKTRIRFSTSLDKNLAQKLEELSEDTRISKSKLLDEALELLFEKHKKDYTDITPKS